MDRSQRGSEHGWQRLAPDGQVYEVAREVAGGVRRTVVLRLNNHGLLVTNPAPGLTPSDHEALSRIGRPQVVLATSAAHPEGLSEFLRDHEGVRAVATTQVAKALRRHTNAQFSDLKYVRPFMPDTAQLLLPPGLSSGEVWLQVRTAYGLAWVVGEAFLDRGALPGGIWGTGLRVKGDRPGLGIPPRFRRKAISDVGAYRSWVLGQIRDSPPSALLAPAGKLVQSPNLRTKLRQLVEALR